MCREPSEGYTFGSVRIDNKGLHRTRRPKENGAENGAAGQHSPEPPSNPWDTLGAAMPQSSIRWSREASGESSANRASRVEMEMRRARSPAPSSRPDASTHASSSRPGHD